MGVGLTVMGVMLLSARIKKLKFSLSLWMLGIMVTTGAFSEFFVKVATNNLPLAHNLALNNFGMGIVFVPALLWKTMRTQMKKEWKNYRFVIITETVTFMAIMMSYLAMAGLPLTIASSLSATQPVFVILLERIAHARFGKMVQDNSLKFKLGAIALVTAGVILLTMSA